MDEEAMLEFNTKIHGSDVLIDIKIDAEDLMNRLVTAATGLAGAAVQVFVPVLHTPNAMDMALSLTPMAAVEGEAAQVTETLVEAQAVKTVTPQAVESAVEGPATAASPPVETPTAAPKPAAEQATAATHPRPKGPATTQGRIAGDPGVVLDRTELQDLAT